MATVIATAITPAQMVSCRENHQTGFIEIEIGRTHFLWPIVSLLAPESSHAPLADASPLPQLEWNPGEQTLRKGDAGAPARSLMGTRAAKLAIVWFSAEGTAARIGLAWRSHFFLESPTEQTEPQESKCAG